MNFSNENISPQDLPSIEDINFYPLEKTYLTAKRIATVISVIVFAVVGMVLFYWIKKLHSPWIIYTTVSITVLITLLNWISDSVGFRNSGYALRDKDILFRKGWIIRKIRVVPLNRVQHVSIQSGPIERRFGLASVSIFTAGSGSADFTIKGITGEKAAQIKEWISNQLNGVIN